MYSHNLSASFVEQSTHDANILLCGSDSTSLVFELWSVANWHEYNADSFGRTCWCEWDFVWFRDNLENWF